MKKLWGGRFKSDIDEEFADFNSSFKFDRRLFRADIEGSLAYCRALERAGIISKDEAHTIQSALTTILERGQGEPGYLDEHPAEDVHSFVEARLAELVGETAYKLHTGRSRNDQVSTDLRLYLREQCDLILELITNVQVSLLDLAESSFDVVIPGYTHLQRAQPVLWAHYLLAYFEMLERDKERFRAARRSINVLPLGSGAIAGTSAAIDREQLARELRFDAIARNSMDAVSDRDFVIEAAFAAATTEMHLSRMAEDLILYSSSEFGFITLGDAVSTGSSLMPQKKNPDALELIRGKAGRVFGHLTALLTMMKGLPLAYNKDLQEDKEAIFDAIDTVAACLKITGIVLKNLTVNAGRAAQAALADYTNATELADYLVCREMPFRRAHELVGRVVLYAAESGKNLADLQIEEYRQFSSLFESDLYEAISLSSALQSKGQPGGTSPDQVRKALQEAREKLAPRKN